MLPVFSVKVYGKLAQKIHYSRICRCESVLDRCVDQVAMCVVCLHNFTCFRGKVEEKVGVASFQYKSHTGAQKHITREYVGVACGCGWYVYDFYTLLIMF